MNTTISTVYSVICGVYFVASLIFLLAAKKKIPNKIIIILTAFMTILLISFTFYFWLGKAKLMENAVNVFLYKIVFGVIVGVAGPIINFMSKNIKLLTRESLEKMDTKEKDKLALQIGYETMLKKRLITKEEYEKKEQELLDEYYI